MNQNEMMKVVLSDGSESVVEVLTFLISDDQLKQYIVYTKREVKGPNGEMVIYISKLFIEGEKYKLVEINDNDEWLAVQKLLKKIANA